MGRIKDNKLVTDLHKIDTIKIDADIKQLFERLTQLKTKRETLFQRCQRAIKESARDVIQQVRADEQQLLQRLHARHRHDTAHLRQTSEHLQHSLDHITSLLRLNASNKTPPPPPRTLSLSGGHSCHN